jgi:hypothetical protein
MVMSRSSRRALGLSLGVLLLLAAGVAYWFLAAAAVEEALAVWVGEQRARGLEVDHGAVEVSGFPFSHRVTIAAPRLADPGHPLAWRWQAERLVISARPWALNRPTITLPPAQTLTYRTRSDATRTVIVTLASGFADVVFADGRLKSAAIAIDGLALSAPDGEASAERIRLTLDPRETGDIDVVLDAVGLRLPPAADSGLGTGIAAVSADAVLKGGLPAGTDAAAVAAWSAAGGAVEVRRFTLRWGDVGVRSSGTIGLDEELRPRAVLDTEIAGHRALLDVLVGRGAVRTRDASLAASVLDLLARPGDNGERVVRLPLIAKDGVLSLGPVALLRLKPVVSP